MGVIGIIGGIDFLGILDRMGFWDTPLSFSAFHHKPEEQTGHEDNECAYEYEDLP